MASRQTGTRIQPVPDGRTTRRAGRAKIVPDVPVPAPRGDSGPEHRSAELASHDPVLLMSREALDDLINSMTHGPSRLSEHLVWAVRFVASRRWKPGDPAVLRDGDPIPGCACEICTRIAANHRVRLALAKQKPRATTGRVSPVEIAAARAVPILNVVRALGVGEPRQVGREYRIRCPIPSHQDRTPSCDINVAKNVWICRGCGAGGDGIELIRATRGVGFVEAVRFIAHV
jgi:hypothetical protein